MSIPVALVVAMSDNGTIGRNGTLPWRIPEDLRRFKKITLGKPCIMGRKTWDSLPRKPLPERTNIVVTHNPSWQAEGARTAHGFAEALAVAAEENPTEIMIIGGEAIFAAALDQAGTIYLTEVEGDVPGDAKMPLFDRDIWQEVSREGPFAAEQWRYSFVTLERK